MVVNPDPAKRFTVLAYGTSVKERWSAEDALDVSTVCTHSSLSDA